MRNKYWLYYLLSFIIVISIFGCDALTNSDQKRGPPWLVYNNSNSRLMDNYINNLYADIEGRVWTGTDSGASYFIYGSWSRVRDPLLFPIAWDDSGHVVRSIAPVKSITQSVDHSIWFGMFGGGIFRYKENSTIKTWNHYTTETDDIPVDFIQSLTTDLFRGEVWCSTLAGVARFIPAKNEGGIWQTFTMDNSTLPSNAVKCTALNFNDNSIWFGILRGGAAFYDGNSNWQEPLFFPPNYSYSVVSIYFDLSNTAWFGKWQGVSCYNIKTFEWHHYTYDNTNGKLPTGSVNAVLTDLKTTRWFGTNYGLVRLQDTTWTTFNTQNSPLPSDTVTALTYDSKGNLWIGTARGVAVFNEKGTRL